MEVTSDRCYEFGVDPDALWHAISAVDHYRAWWPWLRGFDAGSLASGEQWTCVVQPPLPYSLRFTITLDEVVAPRCITATVAGDIVGSAHLEVEERTSGCTARLRSRLAPDNRVLQAVASMARPLVRFGHDWVLDTGARQFRQRAL